jgi:hypothetical protein
MRPFAFVCNDSFMLLNVDLYDKTAHEMHILKKAY